MVMITGEAVDSPNGVVNEEIPLKDPESASTTLDENGSAGTTSASAEGGKSTVAVATVSELPPCKDIPCWHWSNKGPAFEVFLIYIWGTRGNSYPSRIHCT